MNKLITVIIPTYKRAHALPKAIASVQAQSYENWEIVIVDDNDPCSNARAQTEAVMEQYADEQRIKYIRHSANKGACQARNTGVDFAQGEYVAFLDDDDLWLQTKLEQQIDALEKSNAAICYSDMYLEYQGWKKYFGCLGANNLYESLLNQGYGICTSVLLIATDAIRDVEGFDNSLPSMQDYDLLLRLSKKYPAIHLAEALITYQLADDGISCNPVSKANGHRAIIDKYEAEYLHLGLNTGLSRQFESLADFELRSGNRMMAIKKYTHALKLKLLNPRVIVKLMIGTVFGKKPLEAYLQRRQQRTSVNTNAAS